MMLLWYRYLLWPLTPLKCYICTGWKVSKCGIFSGPYFPAFRLNTERNGVSLRTVRMRENTEQNKLRIWTLFTVMAWRTLWQFQPDWVIPICQAPWTMCNPQLPSSIADDISPSFRCWGFFKTSQLTLGLSIDIYINISTPITDKEFKNSLCRLSEIGLY